MRTLRVALLLLGAALTLASASPVFGQSATDAYFDFLIARHLEAQGDTKGAQAQLENAVAGDPQSAEVRAELAAFHLRRDAADDAERIGKRGARTRRRQLRGASRARHVVCGEGR